MLLYVQLENKNNFTLVRGGSQDLLGSLVALQPTWFTSHEKKKNPTHDICERHHTVSEISQTMMFSPPYFRIV